MGRPNKKVYVLTEEGRTALRQWVESPTPLTTLNDEFFLKAYSLWIANPEAMKERFNEQAKLHQNQLELYQDALQSKLLVNTVGTESADVTELSNVLFQYVIGYEENYLAWCKLTAQHFEQREYKRTVKRSFQRFQPPFHQALYETEEIS